MKMAGPISSRPTVDFTGGKVNANVVGAGWRALTRATGSFQLDGQFVAAFGDPGTDGAPNPFWSDPRLLTAPAVQNGRNRTRPGTTVGR